MRNNQLTAAIGLVDDDIVSESLNAKAFHRNSIWLRMGIAAACAACVLGASVVGAYAYFTPVSYVSLDVNPSIEYSLNIFDRVLSAKGVNDDGENILEVIGLTRLKNESVEKAIRKTVNAIAKQGYLGGDAEGGVVVTVSNKQEKKAEKLSEQLKQAVEQAAEEDELDVAVESMAVGEARVQEARSLGVTPGKLNLVEKLKASAESADDIDVEAWLDRSVKDIMQQTKANKALSKGKESGSDDSSDKDKHSDGILDSGKPGNAGKGNNADKPDKAAGKDNGSDKTNPSNNSNNPNKSENAAQKDKSSDKTDRSNGNNGSNKSDNNGNSKKLNAETDADDGDSSGETSETDKDNDNNKDNGNNKDKDNGNSSGNSKNSGKSNSSGKSKSAKK